jgi:hypothetical protein
MTPEELNAVGSISAVVVSLFALGISTYTTWQTAVAGRRPVLVFDYSESGWRVRNVGSGPALNVVIAQKRVGGAWFNPVRVPPLAVGGEFVLKWCLHVNDTGLGATYFDTANRPYTSKCGNDRTTTHTGVTIPKWEEKQIGRHWNHPDYAPEKVG